MTMTDKQRTQFMIAIYGAMQKILKKDNLLNDRGRPKKVKHMSGMQRDGLSVYSWLAESLKNVSEYQLNEEIKTFNTIAQELQDDYWLNMYMLALFMAEILFEEHSPYIVKSMMLPKVERLIKGVSEGIKDANGDKAPQIVRDSKIAASNIHRKWIGKAELTKEVREARINRWREAARNRQK